MELSDGLKKLLGIDTAKPPAHVAESLSQAIEAAAAKGKTLSVGEIESLLATASKNGGPQ